jgi:hypothetical protein
MRRIDLDELMFGLVDDQEYLLCCKGKMDCGYEKSPFLGYSLDYGVITACFQNTDWMLTDPNGQFSPFWTEYGYYLTTED